MSDAGDAPPAELDAMSLLEETVATARELAEKQIELLRAELDEAVTSERRRVVLIVLGTALAVASVAVLLVAGALGLSLIVGHAPLLLLGVGALLAMVCAILYAFGFRRLSQHAFAHSRRIGNEEIAWAARKAEETMSQSSPEISTDSATEARH